MSNIGKESAVFTCVTCNVAFVDSELQRDHYKSDWHRYNLKRKIAEMPVVSFKDFQERLLLQKAQVNSSCICKKTCALRIFTNFHL
jgi:hypothetical protein